MNHLTLVNPAHPNEQTMTSLEMADLTEKRHDSVKRTIENLHGKGLIVQPQIVDEQAPDDMGRMRTTSVYRVGKRDSYVIVAQLSPEFTARLVDRWQELESASPKVLDLNDPHALRAALLGYTEKVLVLEAKVAADAPKVAFAEIIRAMDGVCKIGDFSKAMGMGRNKLFKRLKADKILMETRMPYQKYIDRGYFTVIEQKPYTNSEGATVVTFTTMVTGAGQVFLAKRYADLMEVA